MGRNRDFGEIIVAKQNYFMSKLILIAPEG
jgi:hypothetical protein